MNDESLCRIGKTSGAKQMRTVLHDIILNDDDEELNDFFKDPSNKRMINEPDAIGWTPLHWACSKGLKNSVSALLENGADPNKGTDYDGWTPAHDAARCGNSEILEMLAKAGANIETTTSSGTRPLHYAVQYGRTKAMQWMCKEGCDVDAPNVAGWSPLHFAVRHGRVHAAHMLLDLGAVANMPDKSGHTPEDLARITKDKIKKGILHLEESVQLDDFEKIADMLAEKTKAQRDAAVSMAKHALENADSHFEAEDYFGAIEHLQVARDEYARVGMRDESAVIHLS
uniref:Uncharacterized protein n=1 Tax=Guillardia theta TaxID=55529 RepID=A0A7S4NXZ9_GUITH|mmetsp:Transcript_38718/g.121950  ORF Transcript_38718/g.121950 Transcript_38718/m.121950 type:complete len:285 (+) Transcript_38718:241-1095(+)